jgi:putative hydrolase of the HAD superfamily
MIIKGIIFDINGTLTDIRTNEWYDDVYRVLSNILSYQGILLDPNVVKDLYFQTMKEQRAAYGERYPEFDAVNIFREIIKHHCSRNFWPRHTVPQRAFVCSSIPG